MKTQTSRPPASHISLALLCFVSVFAACSSENSQLDSQPSNDVSQNEASEKPQSHVDGSSANQVINNLPERTKIDLPEISSVALKPRQPVANTNYRFVDLNSSETGIDLVHTWDPPELHRNLVNPIFGTGVAIGDYDNDGLQDVFIAQQTHAGRLYRNLGEMKFVDVTEEAGIDGEGMWASGTTFVDVNNDGWLDLYLCGFDCPNRLYINYNGKFSEQAASWGLDFKGCSIEMTFADYDCDGDLDAYLVTNYMRPEDETIPIRTIRRPGKAPQLAEEVREMFYFVQLPNGKYRRMRGGQYDHLYRNDGNKFVEVTEDAGIGLQPYMGLSANWWDYNSDGWPDLYVANDFSGPDFLYRNDGPDENGQVTFTNVISEACPHTPWYSMGSDFGDINNDGRLDYLGSDMAGTTHYRDKLSMGNMSGPGSAAWFLNFPDPPQYMRNSMYLNSGTKRFIETAFLTGLAKTDWTWSVRFADFDNDGWQDVFFTNGMTRDLQNSDLLEKLRITEQEFHESEEKTKTIKDVVQGFWERQEPFRLENLAYRNTGDLHFDDVGKQWGLDHLGVSTGASVGDLDNDGDLDLVVAGFEEPVKVYRNDLPNSNVIRFKLIGRKSNRSALGTRIELTDKSGNRQVRYLSNTRGFMSTSEPILHFGLANHESVENVTVTWPTKVTQQFDSLACNHLYTIVEPEVSPSITSDEKVPMFRTGDNLAGFRHEELDYDDFDRQPLLPNKYSQLGPGIAWADIDLDGDDDCFIGGAAFYAGQLIENLGDGNFAVKAKQCFEQDSKYEDMAPLFFDADGDKDLDLYVVSGGVECEAGDESLLDRLYLNDGSGNFEKAENALPEIYESGGPVAACDFDRDGDLDLAIGGRIIPGSYPESPRSYLLRNNGGNFEMVVDGNSATGFSTAGMVTSLIWSDVDGDDWPDLLATTEWGPVRFYKNEAGMLNEQTEPVGLAERSGWYNSICGGDIDNDGDMDFVVGNTGLNTKYKATFEKPELLYYGDFEGLGRKRIVEAKYENGTCLPRRGLSCSSHAMPMVKDKTPTFHEFATSSLMELYSEEKLNDATKYAVTSLESGVLINESDESGIKFTFKPLPRLAQASPIFGCVLNDVNSDGNLDIIVAQNFYGPQRETGYFDGGVGLLMTGDGNGGFTSIMPGESGIVVTKDATSLTITDINNDGKADFVFGRNNDIPVVLLNQTTESQNVAAMEKSDTVPAYPPGTKVFIKNVHGKTRLHEVVAGSGYMSQSSNLIFDPGEIVEVQQPKNVEKNE